MALDATEVQKIYIAYLNRPADPAGLEYWTTQVPEEFTLSDLRHNLVNLQPEYQDNYGELTREELVQKTYMSMFGREPDPEGFEYWTTGEGSAVPADQLQQLFVEAASTEDAVVVSARAEIASYYTDSLGDTDYDEDFAQSLLASVMGPEDVEEAKQQVDEAVGEEPGDPGDPDPDPDPQPDPDPDPDPQPDPDPDPDPDPQPDPDPDPDPDPQPDPDPDPDDREILEVAAEDEDVKTSYTAEDLEGYEAIRFNGFSGQNFNFTALGDVAIMAQGSEGIIFNLNEMDSANIELTDSVATLFAETQGDAVLNSLSLTAEGDSSLDLDSSAARGLNEATVEGSGSLSLTGGSIGSEVEGGATLNASALEGSLSVENGVLDHATSVTAGAGDDTLTTGSLAIDVDAGEGDDTLIFTGSYDFTDEDAEAVGAISGVETLEVQSWARIDAADFENVDDFVFTSRGEVFNLGDEQVVTVTDDHFDDSEGATLRLVDAGENVSVVTNFEQQRTLALTVNTSDDVEGGGTLNLAGDGSVTYGEAGHGFETVDATALEGTLNYTGAHYVEETLIMGEGDANLSVFRESGGEDGDGGEPELNATSTVGTLDSVENFDAGRVEFLDFEDEIVSFSNYTSSVEDAEDLDAAFAAVAEAMEGDEYAAFVFQDNTYLYADTETADDAAGLSNGDYAIELTGVTVADQLVG